MTFKAIILACLVSASSFAGMNEAFHSTRSNRSAIPAARCRPAVQRVVVAEKRDLKLEEVQALITSASKRHGVPTALVNRPKSVLPEKVFEIGPLALRQVDVMTSVSDPDGARLSAMRTANATPRVSSYLEASARATERGSSDRTKASRFPNSLLVGLSALAGEPGLF